MTDQHPLTDDIIRYDKKLGCHDLGAWVYTENDLRAAADWELEQVEKAVSTTIADLRRYPAWKEDSDILEFYFNKILKDLRPQEDN